MDRGGLNMWLKTKRERLEEEIRFLKSENQSLEKRIDRIKRIKAESLQNQKEEEKYKCGSKSKKKKN